MIKLVSFVVFIAAFIWTWFLFNSQTKINMQTHAGIQSKFMVLIEESIKTSKPGSSNFEILNIYTQKIDDNQISAHFSYKFTDKLEDAEEASQTMSGEAVLQRGLSENPENDTWVVKSVKTGSSNVEFQQGLVVNPEGAAETLSGDNSTVIAPAEEKKTH